MKKNRIKAAAAALLLSTLFSGVAYAEGWERTGSKWFYWLEDGTCAKSTWIMDEDGINRYWLNADGAMAVNQWVGDNGVWYYVGTDGRLVKNQLLKQNDGKIYWLDEAGIMAANAWIQDGDGAWYYMDASGAAYGKGWHNIDGEDYYFLSSGKLAVNCLVPGGGSVGPDGRRIRK